MSTILPDPTNVPDPVEGEAGVAFVVLGTWVLVVIVVVVAFAISRWMQKPAFVVYDLCSSSEATHFYSVKIKAFQLPKEIIEGSKFMTLDLLSTSGAFVTRLVVPFTESLKNKQKAAAEAVTAVFRVGRKRRLPDVGRIRLDHELWGQTFKVIYVDIKDLNEDEEEPRNFRCNVNSPIKMLNPAEVDVSKYQRDQVFLTEHPINRPGHKKTRGTNLTIGEGSVFFAFAIIVAMCFAFWCPELMDGGKKETKWSQAGINGLAAGFIGGFGSIFMMGVYKFILKKKRRLMGIGGATLVFSCMGITAVALSIWAGVASYNGAVLPSLWALAVLFAALFIATVGVGVGLAIELGSRSRGETLTLPDDTTTQQPPQAGPSGAEAGMA